MMFGGPTFGAVRSPEWPKVRRQWLKENPQCAVCGKKTKLDVHHKIPFHIDPKRELDMSNLITLCADPCHIIFGHCGNWKLYRPNVTEFCETEFTLRQSLVRKLHANRS